MRAAGQVPDPRPVSDDLLHPPTPPPRSHRAVGDRLGIQPRDVRDRLGTRAEGAPTHDNRECHISKKPGHIARKCPTTTTPTPINNAKTGVNNADTMAAHKTTGHVCESCNKPGHTEAQCWSAHPELVTEALLKKRQQELSAQCVRGGRQPTASAPTITPRAWLSPIDDLIWPWCRGGQPDPVYLRKRHGSRRSNIKGDESTLLLLLLLPLLSWLTLHRIQPTLWLPRKRNLGVPLVSKAISTPSRDNYHSLSLMAYLHRV